MPTRYKKREGCVCSVKNQSIKRSAVAQRSSAPMPADIPGRMKTEIRAKGVAAEVHLVPEDLAKGKIKTSGWEVKQVWRF